MTAMVGVCAEGGESAKEHCYGGGQRRGPFLFLCADLALHIGDGISARIGLDRADIRWYSGCVGAGCGRANMAGGPVWATGRIEACRGAHWLVC